MRRLLLTVLATLTILNQFEWLGHLYHVHHHGHKAQISQLKWLPQDHHDQQDDEEELCTYCLTAHQLDKVLLSEHDFINIQLQQKQRLNLSLVSLPQATNRYYHARAPPHSPLNHTS